MIPGLHLSVARGFPAALEELRARGCAAAQILPYRRGQLPSPEELAAFRTGAREAGARFLLVHSRFVPAPASSDPERRRRSAAHLERELRLAAALGADAFVLHAGARSPGASPEEGVRLFAETTRRAAEGAGWGGELLLENVPGGGRRQGGSLEELARLRDALPGLGGLGFCLDTAHAHAAGYELESAEGALGFLARAESLLGPGAVRALHLNDTLAERGSRRESHWHLGRGRLGVEGLRALLRAPALAGRPAVLETPKSPGDDERNLSLAGELAAG